MAGGVAAVSSHKDRFDDQLYNIENKPAQKLRNSLYVLLKSSRKRSLASDCYLTTDSRFAPEKLNPKPQSLATGLKIEFSFGCLRITAPRETF